MPSPSSLDREWIASEVARLGQAAAGAWCPGGGWQYPFDFGDGLVAPTYSPTQHRIHPWRRDAMLALLDRHTGGQYGDLSVLDLGSGEGAMALALWRRGVRDITCVEARANNVDKARFVFNVFGAEPRLIHADVSAFLREDGRQHDIVLFMGLLYHLLDPFTIMAAIGERTRRAAVVETVIARPRLNGFDNRAEYQPLPDAAFHIRRDTVQSHTAGLCDLELWPTPAGLQLLLEHGGFTDWHEAAYDADAPDWFSNGERALGVAIKG